LPLDGVAIMAILNVTPDSFSDGGTIANPNAAAEAACAAVNAGAAILDIGGESTRPGALRVEASEQILRVVPAIRAIRAACGPRPFITIDTTSAEVASAALETGADAINDVSAGLDDPGMLALAAAKRCGIVLMHRPRPPERDSYSDRYATAPVYANVAAEVCKHLAGRADAALRAGVDRASIVLDPGLGFGKTVEQNLALIGQTRALTELGFPVLSGLSRKSFTARAGGLGAESRPVDRLPATLALSLICARLGARILRVHDVHSHAVLLHTAGL